METAKMLPGGLSRYMEYGADLPPVDDEVGQEYSLWDHVERLRFLDVKVPDDEQNIMQKLLRTALPGLVSHFPCDANISIDSVTRKVS
jgi:import receptor subunit TOM20